jgi:hypothetical protein
MASYDRSDASYQLAKAAGLRNVIIGTNLEDRHAFYLATCVTYRDYRGRAER